jgi:hypothetical protein
MAVSVTYKTTAGRINQAEGFLFFNILRPLLLMHPILGAGKPPTYSDPPTPGTWTMTNAYAAGALVLDSNNNVQMCTTAGTSGSTQPTWNTVYGGTTADGSTLIWTNIGPSYVWAATTKVIFDQQIRDTNNNIQQVIVEGTTAGTAPTWATAYGAITIDGNVSWMCLGPTLALGATTGSLTFSMTPKIEPLMADQYTVALDYVTTEETGDIEGELEELTATNLSRIMPNTLYSTGTDTQFPSGAQAFAETTFGGQLKVPRACWCVASPVRQFGNSIDLASQPFRYRIGTIYAVGPTPDGKLPMSLKKMTSYKVKAGGSGVTWRFAGDYVGQFVDFSGYV